MKVGTKNIDKPLSTPKKYTPNPAPITSKVAGLTAELEKTKQQLTEVCDRVGECEKIIADRSLNTYANSRSIVREREERERIMDKMKQKQDYILSVLHENDLEPKLPEHTGLE